MNKKTSNPVAKVLLGIFFIILCILFLIPLYALLLGTFKGGAELFVSGLNLNPSFELLHTKAWRYLFTGIMSNGEYNPHDYFLWYRNSLMVVLVQGSLTLLLSSMVAYGLAKYNFKGKNVIFMCVLMVMMVPLEILMLPMYTQVNAMGLRNEAGRIDGCTEYGVFFRIIVPVMKPAYASMAVLTGMGAWNALLWPMLVLSDMKKYTIPIGLNTLWSPYGNNYDLMITGSCFAILPLLLIYLFAQRFIVEGMTAGAVKG